MLKAASQFAASRRRWERASSGSGFFVALVDLLGTLMLILSALLVGPVLILRGPLALARLWQYLWVFLPKGLCNSVVRGLIDWRLGNFGSAIAQVEGVISLTLAARKHSHLTGTERAVLEDLFTLLARAYLHMGHIDEAMHAVLRAGKILGIERLRKLSDIDCKTAHLVRAGLAAGKLLDGDGVAALFVKSSPPTEQHQSKHRPLSPVSALDTGNSTIQDDDPSSHFQDRDRPRGGVSKPGEGRRNLPAGCKIIPFPPQHHGS
jgi:hypothetical protein